MSAIIPILVGVAAKVGAPIVAGILRDAIGGKTGDLAGKVVETIAGHVGAPAEEIPTIAAQDPARVEAAVRVAEAETPELIAAWVESQKLANDLQKAEMAKSEAPWTWAWRPAWMWLLAFLWTYAIVLRPVVNAATGAKIEAVDLGVLVTLTGAYLALYMGGHTVKGIFGRPK